MKRKNIKQTFEDDTISTLNEIIPLIITNKGHYAIPITKAKQMIKYFDRETSMQITLSILNNQYNYNTALNYIIQVSLVLQQKTKGGDQECIKKLHNLQTAQQGHTYTSCWFSYGHSTSNDCPYGSEKGKILYQLVDHCTQSSVCIHSKQKF